jgi:hypothetical protein
MRIQNADMRDRLVRALVHSIASVSLFHPNIFLPACQVPFFYIRAVF